MQTLFLDKKQIDDKSINVPQCNWGVAVVALYTYGNKLASKINAEVMGNLLGNNISP